MEERIVLGSGRLYIKEFQKGQARPSDDMIEKDENLLGLIQGGATLDYAGTFYTAKDDFGKVSKTIITDEAVNMKSGIMTWSGKTLAALCSTARIDDSVQGKRTVKIGGAANDNGKMYLLRFVHIDKQDGDIRLTIIGKNTAGFSLAFVKDKETVVDAQFTAQPALDNEGTLVEYEETEPGFGVSIEVPTATPPEGAVESGTEITLSCATPGAVIYYNIGDSAVAEPDNESTQYSTPIAITANKTIKATAYVGSAYSEVLTASYTVE